MASPLLATAGFWLPATPLGLRPWEVSLLVVAAVLIVAGVACTIHSLGRPGTPIGPHQSPDDGIGDLMWTQVRMKALIRSALDGMEAIEAGRPLRVDAVRTATDLSGAKDPRRAVDKGGRATRRAQERS